MIIERDEKGTVALCGSELLLGEVLAYSALSRDQAAMLLEDIRSLAIDLLPVTEQVVVEVARLRRENGLGMADAIHVATALGAGAGSFVTNDSGITERQVEGMVWRSFDAAELASVRGLPSK